MYLIGLTGGIASGKSVVSRRLAELGAVHIDADVLAREVVEPGEPALAAIAEHFGPGVQASDGTLDRPALGAIVFADASERAVLNGITHPAVWKRARAIIEATQAANPAAVVVYDVPLLAESGADRVMQFDLIVVVHASRSTRLERLMTIRGLTRDDAVHRLDAQATDAQRLAIADVVIDSDGDLATTLAQADELWAMASAASSAASKHEP
jgi:dephospho-CoA kinase